MRTHVHFALAALGIVTLASAASAGDDPVIGGQLEFNYTHNFTKPSTRNNTFLFNNTDGEFNVNLGEIHVKKAATDKAAGYTLRLVTGRLQEYFDMTYKTGHLLEGYGTTVHGTGNKAITIDYGQMISHVGLETPDTGSSQFFSKSFNYQYLQPFVHAGIHATKALDSKTTFMGILANRFDGVRDMGNRDLAVGFQFARKTSDTVSWTINALTARENMATTAAPISRDANVLNFVYNNKVSEAVSIALDATSRGGKDLNNRSYTTTGITGYLSRKLASGNTFSVRAEYLNQNISSVSAPLGQYATDPARKPSMTSITAAYELACAENSRTLVEFRWDHAGGAIFPSSTANSVKDEQTSINFSKIFKF